MKNFKSISRIAGIFTLLCVSITLIAQSPKGFSYQAVARDADQNPLANVSLIVHFSILDGTEQLVWKEQHSVTTNELGMFSQIICNDDAGKTGGTASSLSLINWGSSPHSIGVEVDDGSTVIDMGTSPLMAVPYALFAINTEQDGDGDSNNEIQDLLLDGTTLSITKNDNATFIDLSPFQGTNTDQQELNLNGTELSIDNGNLVDLAVLQDGVNDADSLPANEIQDLLFSSGQLMISNNVSATNVNLEAYNENTIGWKRDADRVIYMDGNVGVGTVTPEGRLSVQGVDEATEEPLFMVRRKDGYPVFAVFEDGVYAYTDTVDSSKGIKGGFAVGGYNQQSKGIGDEYMRINADSIRFYVDTDPNGKGIKGGFAVGGYNQRSKESDLNELFRITPDSVRVYIEHEQPGKGIKGGFAVGGYNQRSKGMKDYFNISGYFPSGLTIPGENRVVWYPQKNAFMVGNVLVEDENLVGENSFASGYQSQAMGNYSEALGFQSKAGGEYSTAIGKEPEAWGDNSVSIGDQSRADATSSFALGTGAVAFGVNSYAIGSSGIDSANVPTEFTKAHGEQSFAIGMGSESLAFGSFAVGTQNIASGNYSLAMGYNTNASHWYSTSLGWKTISSGQASTAMGATTTASGWYSNAMGRNSEATNHYSTAIGREAIASGYNSLAMGAYLSASGKNSTAMGAYTSAEGEQSTALGKNTTASGNQSTAMGDLTIAAGIASTAFGRGPDALGNYSFAAGIHTVASAYASNVFGRYNKIPASFSAVSWDEADPLFTIGCGSDNNTRRNAFLIQKNGETYFPYVYADAVEATNRVLYIDSDGKIGGLISSLRYKDNITSQENADWLYQLRPVNFIYKEDETEKNQYGLIAEEVEEVNSEFVFYNKEGEIESVLYSKLVTPMLKAIQDQNDQIQEQQTIITERESEIEDLKSRLEKIEKYLELD